MEKWKEAEEDASRSIEMGNDNARKYDRRGQARFNLDNFEGALEDFNRAKDLDPKTKGVNENIERCRKSLQIIGEKDRDKKEATLKKAKREDTADKGSKNSHTINHTNSVPSNSEDESSVVKSPEAVETNKKDDFITSAQNLGQSKKERTDEELRQENETEKQKLERRFETKLDKEAKKDTDKDGERGKAVDKNKEGVTFDINMDEKAREEMIKLIREKILEEEKLKLVQERLALRNMVERYEAEERRRNFESREQTTDPVFGVASSSEVCFQTIFKEYLYFV